MSIPWLTKAISYLGTSEYKGSKHNPIILRWWVKIRAPFTDDETPWCAAFVGGVLEECGIKSTRSASARSYSYWGMRLEQPVKGCVVVLWRGKPLGPYGHVGFLDGIDKDGNIRVLGGNQGDKVSYSFFPKSRVLSFRWPIEVPFVREELTLVNNQIGLSIKES